MDALCEREMCSFPDESRRRRRGQEEEAFEGIEFEFIDNDDELRREERSASAESESACSPANLRSFLRNSTEDLEGGVSSWISAAVARRCMSKFLRGPKIMI